MSSSFQVIDSPRLITDRMYRIKFLTDFIQFGPADTAALHRVAPIVGPLVPTVVDAVYKHLFNFSNTKAIFLRRNAKFVDTEDFSPSPDAQVDEEQMATLKDFLSGWAVKIFTANFDDEKTWAYLDRVGEMHSGVSGFKHREAKQPLFVDLVLCSSLLAWVESLLIGAVLGIPEETLSHAHKTETVLAINKLLWIQNDLFTRHFVKEGIENLPTEKKGEEIKVVVAEKKSWIENATGVSVAPAAIYGVVVLAMGGMLLRQAGKA